MGALEKAGGAAARELDLLESEKVLVAQKERQLAEKRGNFSSPG